MFESILFSLVWVTKLMCFDLVCVYVNYLFMLLHLFCSDHGVGLLWWNKYCLCVLANKLSWIIPPTPSLNVHTPSFPVSKWLIWPCLHTDPYQHHSLCLQYAFPHAAAHSSAWLIKLIHMPLMTYCHLFLMGGTYQRALSISHLSRVT